MDYDCGGCACHLNPPCSHCTGDCSCLLLCSGCDKEITTMEQIDFDDQCESCWKNKKGGSDGNIKMQ